jgi:tetratricopeptide (TPR) repeat protein
MFPELAVGELFNLVKKGAVNYLGPEYEEDEIINKTNKAIETTLDRFFDEFNTDFGKRSQSFLARQDNIDRLIRRIYLDHQDLKPGDLNPDGDVGIPSASPEALAFVIRVFEEEIKKDRALVKEIETIKRNREIEEINKRTRRIEKNQTQQQASVTDPPPHLLTPLPPRKTDLVGRDEDMTQLHERVNKARPLLLVNGLGGIGKTELCKRFIHEHHSHYSHVAWIDYSHSLKDAMAAALARPGAGLVRVTGSETTAQLFDGVMDRLNNMGNSLLLIVDNIDIENNADPDLDRLLGLPFTVIANSRSILQGFQVMTLDFLSDDACLELFYCHYKGEKDDECAAKIIQLCGCHTLTVELLARTARNAGKPVQWLYDHLMTKGFNLNDVIKDRVHTFWHDTKERKKFFNHLLTIFDLSAVTDEEIAVLTQLSVLPAIYIPMDWVQEWLKLEHNEAVNALVMKGWLRRAKNEIFMHQVIQEVIRHLTEPDATKCKELILSLKWKLSCKPEENPIDKKPFVVFGESLLRHVHDMDEELGALANNLALRYQEFGQLPEALEFQERAIKIYEEVLVEDHPRLATSYNNLSMIYLVQGNLGGALDFQKKTVKIFEKVLEETDPKLATSYNNLSMIYKDQGNLDGALEFQLKDVKISEKVLGENHPDLATSYNNLSMIYQDQGNLDGALEFQKKAIEIVEKVLGKKHPNLAASYNNLSLIYQDQGNHDGALEFQKKALSIREAVLGENHPDLATSYNNLSLIYKAQGKLDEALEFQKKAIEIVEKVLGKYHPNLAASYNNLSLIYQDQGNLDGALEFQQKALNIREAVLGENHPDLATSYNNLSRIYQAQGNLPQARELAEKAVAILKALFPNGHPHLSAAEQNLEIILEDRDFKD